ADAPFASLVRQAMADVFMLTVPPEPGTWHAVDRYVYAGIPWFATVFGRDALITARQLLAFAPGIARGVLRVLAALQGTTEDPARDEQPGWIIHEARHGEMAATGEVPFRCYYGSIAATPLFCMLLGACARQAPVRGRHIERRAAALLRRARCGARGTARGPAPRSGAVLRLGHPHARDRRAPLQPDELSQRVGVAARQLAHRRRPAALR